MYLARITDEGDLKVYPVMEWSEARTWRFGKPSAWASAMRDCGWASIQRGSKAAIAAVHAVMEQREAA